MVDFSKSDMVRATALETCEVVLREKRMEEVKQFKYYEN